MTLLSSLRRFLADRSTHRGTCARRPTFRPRLEALEDRVTPSTGGLLDPTFGSGGVVASSFTNNYDAAHAVIAQPDGKIVVAGDTLASGSRTGNDFLIARYNPDGSLDSGFGTGGHTVTDFNGLTDHALAVALQAQPNGTNKILAAGYVFNSKGRTGNSDFGLARYNANGTLDATFGSKGKAETDLGGNDAVTGMAVQPDGKIVVVGYTDASGTTVAALARYNANGTLDTTFGNGGKIITAIRLPDQNVTVALQSQPDGTFKIVLAGRTLVTVGSTTDFPFIVARYNANGTVDSGFGTGGQTTTLIGANDHFGGVAVQADGKIVVAGSNGSGLYPNAFYVVRYTANGSPDAGFGTAGDGTLTVPMPTGYLAGLPHGVAVQADGQILVGGQLTDASSSHFIHFSLLRVNGDASPNGPAGTVDTGYGAAGWVANPMVEYNDTDQALTIEPDGKAVTAGFARRNASSPFPTDLVLLRFLSSAPQIGAFTANPNPVTAGGSVTLTASGITDGNANSIVTQVAFYVDSNGDGKLDSGDALLGYGTQTNGVWTYTFSTTGWASGNYTLFAQAQDSYGALGDPFALSLQVN